MASYLWRKLSEQEKKQVKEESKKLILEFGDVIEKLPARKEVFVEREADVREESEDGKSLKTPPTTHPELRDSFRDLMLKNAPEVKDDCIVAEKGEWTK